MSDVKDWSPAAGSNNAAPPNGWPENMAPSTVNDSAREVMAAIRRWYSDIAGVNTSAGTGNAYTLAASQTITAYAAGNLFLFIADRANTGASTLAVDGLAAKSLKKNLNVELAANDIKAGQLVAVAYHAATDSFQMLSGLGNDPLADAANTAKLNVEDQALTGGVVVTSKSLGTISTGTVTPDPGDRPMQHYTNGGAHTLAPSTNTGSVLVDITNNATAGAITTSGFTLVTGDSFTTTNTQKFRCHISIGNAGSLLQVQALQ